MIRFTCPHCKVELSVESQYVGMTGPCRSCGAQITITRPPQVPAFGVSDTAPIRRPTRQSSKSPDGLFSTALLLVGAVCGSLLTLGYQRFQLPSIAQAEEKGREVGEAFNKGLAQSIPMFRDQLDAKEEAGEILSSSKEARLVLVKTEYATRFKLVGPRATLFIDCSHGAELATALGRSQEMSDRAKKEKGAQLPRIDVQSLSVRFYVSGAGQFRVMILDRDSSLSALSIDLPTAIAFAKQLTERSRDCR